jgi:hypothetical protein
LDKYPASVLTLTYLLFTLVFEPLTLYNMPSINHITSADQYPGILGDSKYSVSNASNP